MKMSPVWKRNPTWSKNKGWIGWRGWGRRRVWSCEIPIREKGGCCCATGWCKQKEKYPGNFRYNLFLPRILSFQGAWSDLQLQLSITELSEKAKQDLMEFEEQERQKRQNRHGGRGRGGGRGGRVRGGCPSFGLMDFRGGNRGRINDHRPPLMGAMGKLVGYCVLTHLRRFSNIAHCCSPLIFSRLFPAIPNACTSSASSAASAVPAAPPSAPKGTSSVPRAWAPACPTTSSAPHPPTHETPFPTAPISDGASTTDYELPTTQLPTTPPRAPPTAQKHPY